MRALNAFIGDGSTKVKKVYRGQDLIYMRPPEHYIECIADNPFGGITANFDDSVFIPVQGNYELEYGDIFEIDVEMPPQGSYVTSGRCLATIIGGSFNKDSWYDGDYYNGIQVTFDNAYNDIRMCLGIQARNNNRARKVTENLNLGERKVVTLTYDGQGESYSPYIETTRTDGGFFLFAYKAYDTELPFNQENNEGYTCHLFNGHSGKFYRITIKDSNNNLKYDFMPWKQDNQIGMIDMVSSVFYPANDSTKFAYDGQTVERPMLRGMRRSVRTGNIFDGITKIYYNQTEIPLINIQDRWWWDKFNYDIRKFEIVEEED